MRLLLGVATDHPGRAWESEHWDVRAGTLKGFSNYTHVASGRGAWDGISLLIGKPLGDPAGAEGKNRIRLMIGSAVLWRHYVGGSNAHQCAEETLEQLLGTVVTALPDPTAIAPRRVDLCSDHWGYTWDLSDLERFATSAKGRGAANGSGDLVETLVGDTWVYRAPGGKTLYVGRRGSAARFLRIYDKIAEAAKTGKLPWLEPIWKAHGWDGKTTVWRAEVEHGGEWLRQHGCATLDDLKGCERSLWRDYVKSVRHTTGNETRVKRRKSSQVWRHLSVAPGGQRLGTWEWQPRPLSEGGDMEQLLAMAAGCLFKVQKAIAEGPSQLHPGKLTPWMGSVDPSAVGEAMQIMLSKALAAKTEREARRQCRG